MLQGRALDNLLRAIDRFPQVLTFLAERQGAPVPTNAGWAEPRPREASGLALPQSLRTRLEREAQAEGVAPEVYAASVLSDALARRPANRQIEELSRKLDGILESPRAGRRGRA